MRHKQDHTASAEDWATIAPPHKHGAIDTLIKAVEIMQAEIEELQTRVKILEIANRPPDS